MCHPRQKLFPYTNSYSETCEYILRNFTHRKEEISLFEFMQRMMVLLLGFGICSVLAYVVIMVK